MTKTQSEIKQIIPKVSQRIDQLKTSIEIIQKQNENYLQNLSRFTNKNEQQKLKRETFEEKKNRLETTIDQKEEMKKRSEIIVDNLNGFLSRMNQIMKYITQLKEEYEKEIKTYGNEIESMKKEFIQTIEKMEDEELKPYEDERMKIKEKYQQMKNQYQQRIIEIDADEIL